MTETTTTSTDTQPPRRTGTCIMAGLALAISILVAVLTLVPAARTVWPWPLPLLEGSAINVDMTPLDAKIEAQSRRVDVLQNMVTGLEGQVEALPAQAAPAVPAVLPDDVAARLAALEERATAATATLDSQRLQLAGTTKLPLALALLRLEQRFVRGQNFTEALSLAQSLLPQALNEADATALMVAAPGVPTTDDLTRQLDAAERGMRRDARLANVQNPLERIWAELQSLVLVKTDADNAADNVSITLRQLRAALATEDAASFEAAWQSVPAASQTRLDAWASNVRRRLTAQAVLKDLFTATLGPSLTQTAVEGAN